MKPTWVWLRDDKNREILKMGGAGLAALAAAGWAVFTFAGGHHDAPAVNAAAGGMAAGHDISGNTITMAPGAASSVPSPPPAKP